METQIATTRPGSEPELDGEPLHRDSGATHGML
jgi:hypothetical protein